MSFLHPAWLWAFSAIIPLAALYLLKVRPERADTTALFLWEKIFQESKSSALFRKFRDLFSFMLIALAVSCLVLAMAEPVFHENDAKKNTVLIIDNSASMSAIEKNGRTRLEEARATASNIIENVSGASKTISLYSISNTLNLICGASSSQKALMNGLSEIKETLMPCREEALEVFKREKDFLDKSKIILISDADFKGAASLKDIEILKVGTSLENLGISAFDIQKLHGTKDKFRVYFNIVSSFKEPKYADIILYAGSEENPVKVYPLQAVCGLKNPVLMTVSSAYTANWILKINIRDPLAADNTAYAVLASEKLIKLKVDSGQNADFLRNSVSAFNEGDTQLELNDKNPDIVLSCGNEGKKPLDRPYIIFQPEGESMFWRSCTDEIPQDIALFNEEKHPALKFCDLKDFIFTGARKIELAGNALIIASSREEKIPLIAKTSANGHTAFVVNMHPDKSNFFFNINFPLLIYSMASDLTGAKSGRALNFSTGDSLSDEYKNISGIRTPASSGNFTKPSPENTTVSQTGFFELLLNDGEKLLCSASLHDEYKSFLESPDISKTCTTAEKERSFSNILIVIAMLIIALECILYHRRKAS